MFEMLTSLKNSIDLTNISEVLALKELARENNVHLDVQLPTLSSTAPVFEMSPYDHFARA